MRLTLWSVDPPPGDAAQEDHGFGRPAGRAVLRGLLVALLASAPLGAAEVEPPADRLADAALLAEANNDFALQLFQELRVHAGNLVVAPYDLSRAFALAYAGARGETARQLETVLHWGAVSTNLQARFATLEGLLREAQGAGDLERLEARSLWPMKRFPLREDFLSLIQTNYGVAITPLSFVGNQEKARALINQSVDEQTRHCFKEVLERGLLDDLTRMILVSAASFKGRWAVPFPSPATNLAAFHLDATNSVNVPFLTQRCAFPYAESDLVQVLVLPFRGERMQMVALLPRGTNNLEALEDGLSAVRLSRWTWSPQPRLLDLALPKFAISNVFAFPQTAESAGIADAYQVRRADFSGMDGTPHWLCLSRVVHAVALEVNEWGVNAPASKPVQIFAPSREQPVSLRADRPFLFLIRDVRTGSILFFGRVADPRGPSTGVQ